MPALIDSLHILIFIESTGRFSKSCHRNASLQSFIGEFYQTWKYFSPNGTSSFLENKKGRKTSKFFFDVHILSIPQTIKIALKNPTGQSYLDAYINVFKKEKVGILWFETECWSMFSSLWGWWSDSRATVQGKSLYVDLKRTTQAPCMLWPTPELLYSYSMLLAFLVHFTSSLT